MRCIRFLPRVDDRAADMRRARRQKPGERTIGGHAIEYDVDEEGKTLLVTQVADGRDGLVGRSGLHACRRMLGIGGEKDIPRRSRREYRRNAEMIEAQGPRALQMRAPLGNRAAQAPIHVVDSAKDTRE